MLVLNRKSRQELMLGDDIKVTVLKIQGNRVKLGISAPDGVLILRGEIRSHRPKEFVVDLLKQRAG